VVGWLKAFCKAVDPDKNKNSINRLSLFQKKVPAENYDSIFFSKNLGCRGSKNNRFFSAVKHFFCVSRVEKYRKPRVSA
jgi:hypothetical protein